MAPMPPRIMCLARPPLPIGLNILLIWAYWRRSLLTSCTVVPEPGAMRLRRVPLMISWSWRSLGVIELMMASTRVNWLFVYVFDGLLHAGEGADGGEHLEDAISMRAQLLDLT